MSFWRPFVGALVVWAVLFGVLKACGDLERRDREEMPPPRPDTRWFDPAPPAQPDGFDRGAAPADRPPATRDPH